MDDPVAPTSESPPIPPAPVPAHSPGEPFLFHGKAPEYFRIWVTNLLLTILTVGVYAAWAKVRRRRYLRGNIELMGHRFHYTARPLRLFIGNLVVLAFFLAYAVFGSVYVGVKLGAIAAALCLLPWIVVRSLSFNAHNTVYRGLRFRFHPTLSGAFMAYLLKLLAVIFTFGLYYPAWARAKREFQVSNHRYGNGYFRFKAGTGPFYATYVPAALGMLFVFILAAILLWVFRTSPQLQSASLIVTFGLYLPALFLARQFIHARLFNVVWNGSLLDDCRFEASMDTWKWMNLQVGNWTAIIGTCGFLYPWAVMRTARYTASCLRFHPTEEFFRLHRLGGSGGAALGDSAAEFIGLDFGL